MKIKKFLATTIAVAMAIIMMPNFNMVVHAVTPDCSCGHPYGQHNPMSGACNICAEEEGPCSGYDGTHAHEYGGWLSNESYHWKDCADQSPLCRAPKTEDVAHVWNSTTGECSVCAYACGHSGATSGTCSICGKVLSAPTCEHTYGGAWEATPCGTMHWQKCTKCGEYGNNQDHTAPCSVCGYGATSSSSSSTPAAPTAEQMHEEYAKAVEATVAKEEALPVTSFASEVAVKAIPAEVKADNAATLNISAVTTTQGFVATINKVAKATTAPSMAVYSAKPITMNATALNAVAKTGKTLVYTFTYKGHIYKVTIPAGAKVNTNGQMFMGPLAIGAQLGTTQVIK